MKPRRKITPAIVVEGKYDKIRLESAVDAVILVTGGFRIYHNAEQLALIRYYAETTGIVILTDADAAGFQIRSYLKSTIRTGTIYHVYIPGIHGKEHRKRLPSAEGLLGVEGMRPEILLEALRRAGATENDSVPWATSALFYSLGLTGKAGSADLRKKLAVSLDLPAGISQADLKKAVSTELRDLLSRLTSG